ncbi:lipopolysaccharide heptosyltransferase II [Candidatus Nitrospira bockiana]
MSTSAAHRASLITHHDPVRRILIRATNWVGDAVLTEPALSALHAALPDAELTLLARPAVAELFTAHPALSRILFYDHRGRHARLSGKWTLAGELRRYRFDLAVLFQNAFEAALLAFLAGVPRRYGYATDGRRLLLTQAVPVAPPTLVKHQIHYYLDLLRLLGIEPVARAPRLYVTREEEAEAERRLAEAGADPRDLLIGLNPGSTYGSAKRWLPERFAQTADRLAADVGARVVIVGAPGEESLGQAIAASMTSSPIVLSGRTSIRQLMAVIRRCRLFLTNDTGPMHIAAAFGVPVVAVFGPTDTRTTAPYGEDHAIVRQPVECSPCLLRECPIDHRCMTRISVDQVYSTASEKLRGQRSAFSLQRSSAQHSALSTQHLSLKGVTVFLDRDGTLNRDTGYVKSPDELELLPGVADAIARLNREGARVVVVTNQSAIARGLMSVDTLGRIHETLVTRLAAAGASLDAVYFCPHHPDEGCGCRKPATGMIDRAVSDLGLDLGAAYVVGDQNRDMELAARIGARRILVMSGQTSRQTLADLGAGGARPDHVADGLLDAVDWIIEDVSKRVIGK